jgi:hypothetical protein
MKTNKKLVALMAVAGSLLMAGALVITAAAAPNPFRGAWHSVDVDGSNQTLRIGGGPGSSYHVHYFDDGATVCGLDPVTGDFLYAAFARGVLAGSGYTIAGDLPVYCLAHPRYLYATAPFGYTYDPGTNTLTDVQGIVWYR